MSRDLVLGTLVLGLCGSVTWLAGFALGHDPEARPEESGRAAERRRWRRLWLPLVPAAACLAALTGWAIQEPCSTDELLRPLALVGVAPLALGWLRAAVRAARALAPPRIAPVAATFGLFRPRVVVGAALRQRLDGASLDAALAHEQAHARHRDPLRIWLAQIATDLQWPSPAAAQRLRLWSEALELARDEEVRQAGVRGEDLAQALVTAIRLARHRSLRAGARLTGPEKTLVERIHRLLSPLRPGRPEHRWVLSLAIVTALAASVFFGVAHGDLLVRALPLIAS